MFGGNRVGTPNMTAPLVSNFAAKVWRRLLALWVFIGTALALLVVFAATLPHEGADAPQCRSIYMFPSYARLKGFDTTHTRFAVKYNVFLYREQGKDKEVDEHQQLDGVPVLFIPGNAGSFKQVRSIASQCASISHEHSLDEDFQGRNLDFFAAHFNEDFTAFHGRTMLDQAEYLNDAVKFILGLYKNSTSPPQSVILVGHSMGGVVARVMLTLPNFAENSVNTIVTLAAPHAVAPATFDGDIIRIYAATEQFWQQGLAGPSKGLAHERLKNVSIISITGGLSDTILPADYTTMRGTVPDAHGLTVYTTGIPRVWTPIDHLAIVWCDQLRQVVAQMLIDIVEPKSITRTKPLEERMRIFRRHLLSGFEESLDVEQPQREPFRLRLKKEQISLEGKLWTLRGPDDKFHISPITDMLLPTFSLLSTTLPGKFDQDSSDACLLLCKEYPGPLPRKSFGKLNLEKADFECVDISDEIHPVPNTLGAQFDLSDSSLGGTHSPLFGMYLSPEVLQGYTYVVYHPFKTASFSDFASLALSTSAHDIIVDTSIMDLLLGKTLTMSNESRPLVSKIAFPGVWSSLLSYTYTVDIESSHTQFQPFLRQSVRDPLETKWILQLDQPKHVSFHGIAPYTPFTPRNTYLNLELWAPSGASDAVITVKIDLLRSLRLWIMRYRLVISCFPIAVITLAMAFQFCKYFDTGIFPTFEEGLSMLSDKSIPVFIALSLMTPLASTSGVKSLLYHIAPVTLTRPSVESELSLNQFFLGIEENYLWILGPLFFALAFAFVHIVVWVVRLVLMIAPFVIFACGKMLTYTKVLQLPILQTIYNWNSNTMQRNRRLGSSMLLLLFVMVYIPYQFAYIVCCLVQAVTTIKTNIPSSHNHKEKIDMRKVSIANFNATILVLMLWIIPVNVPVLVVFFHNMAVRWETPFTSHHNILAIFPIILLVGRSVQGSCLPYTLGPLQKKVTIAVLCYFAFFTLCYGVRHLYWLHYLLNFLAAWLFLLSFPINRVQA